MRYLGKPNNGLVCCNANCRNANRERQAATTAATEAEMRKRMEERRAAEEQQRRLAAAARRLSTASTGPVQRTRPAAALLGQPGSTNGRGFYRDVHTARNERRETSRPSRSL